MTRSWGQTGLHRLKLTVPTGIMLFTLGWILHWPSLITLALWPILMAAYVWLALFEERQAQEEFGAVYAEYAQHTKRFIPGLI